MRRRSQLSELNERQSLIWIIIIASVAISALILILSKIYLDRNNNPTPEIPSFTLQTENFPTIQLGHYALWGRKNDESILFIKRFNSIDNQIKNLDGRDLTELSLEKLNELNSFFVTIENEGDRDETPNNFILMESQILEGKSELKFELSIPKTDSTFMLATPTDGNSTINELSGLWFKDADEELPSLNLPLSQQNFIYEIRLINTIANNSLLIGRFDNPREEDNSKIYSLTSEGFKFPGEDLLRNLPEPLEAPLNLANGDYQVVVSLEPDIDGVDITGEDIFLRLLSKQIPQNSPEKENIILEADYKPIQLRIEIND
jgi:hypothetical protein